MYIRVKVPNAIARESVRRIIDEYTPFGGVNGPTEQDDSVVFFHDAEHHDEAVSFAKLLIGATTGGWGNVGIWVGSDDGTEVNL